MTRRSCTDLVAEAEAAPYTADRPLASHRGRVVIVDDSAPVACNADGSAVCRHRDLSVCPGCRAANGAYVVVHGATYYVPDPAERDELVALLTGAE